MESFGQGTASTMEPPAMTSRRTFIGLSGVDWGIVLIAINNVALPSVLPVLIGTLARDLGFGVARAGYITSISGAATVLGSLCFPVLVLRMPRWLLLTGGILVMTVGLFLTVLSASYEWVLTARIIAGFADGVSAAACYSLMAGASNPSRLLGMYTTGQGLTGVVGMAFLPSMIAALGWRSLFIFSALLAVPAVIFSPKVGKYHEHDALVLREPTLFLPARALASLGTLFLMFAGLASLWAFIEPIGQARGYNTGMVSFALSLSAASMMIGPLLVTIVAYRLSIRSAALIGSIIVAFAVGGLTIRSYPLFCTSIFAVNFAWGFLFPFLFRSVSNSDPSGRAASVTSVVTVSAVSAAGMSGALLEWMGETALMAVGGIVTIVGLLLAALLHGKEWLPSARHPLD